VGTFFSLLVRAFFSVARLPWDALFILMPRFSFTFALLDRFICEERKIFMPLTRVLAILKAFLFTARLDSSLFASIVNELILAILYGAFVPSSTLCGLFFHAVLPSLRALSARNRPFHFRALRAGPSHDSVEMLHPLDSHWIFFFIFFFSAFSFLASSPGDIRTPVTVAGDSFHRGCLTGLYTFVLLFPSLFFTLTYPRLPVRLTDFLLFAADARDRRS